MRTTTATQGNFLNPNLSISDRQLRFIVGATMIGVTLLVTPETLGMWSIVLLASIPFIASAIVGWDPLYAIAGLSTHVEGEEDIQQRNWTCSNIGTLDRAVRLGVGLALIYSLLTMGSMGANMVFTLLAIPLIVTAIIAWDPLYAALGINSFASRLDVEAGEPDNSELTLAACYNFPSKDKQSALYPHAA